MKVASAVLQLLGLGLALAGVAAVRSWLSWTAQAADEVKQDLTWRWARRRAQFRARWARCRGQGVVYSKSGAGTARASGAGAVSVAVTRKGPDLATISDREWLVLLDDQVEALYGHANQVNVRHAAYRKEWDRLLAAERDEFRRELLDATQGGWKLVVWGAALTAAGTVLGIWA